MDKYRIDSYRKQGMTYDEAVQKIEDIADSETKKNKIHVVKNEIWGEDTEISKTFIFLRNLLWGVIYYAIYKIIGFVFEIFFKFRNCCSTRNAQYGGNQVVVTPSQNQNQNETESQSGNLSKMGCILGKIFCLPKSSVPSVPSVPSMSNILNQDICSPECSPRGFGGGNSNGNGLEFPQFLMSLKL
jgi:hypothetical protein